MPRIDLPKQHMTGLSLATTSRVDLETELPESGYFTRFDLDAASEVSLGYHKSGATHVVIAQMLDTEDEELLAFDMQYVTDPTRQIPKPPAHLNTEGELLAWRERDETAYTFTCSVHF